MSATSTSRYVRAPTDSHRFLVFDPSVPTFDRVQFGVKAMAALATGEEWMAAYDTRRRLCEINGTVDNGSGESAESATDIYDAVLPPAASVAFSTVGMPKALRDIHNASVAAQRVAASTLSPTTTTNPAPSSLSSPSFPSSSAPLASPPEAATANGSPLCPSASSFSPSLGLAFSHYCELRIVTDPYHPALGQYGVFARRPIPPGTTLTPYAGTIQFCNLNPSSRCYVMSHAHTATMEIDGEFVGNFARFANDPRGVPVYAAAGAGASPVASPLTNVSANAHASESAFKAPPPLPSMVGANANNAAHAASSHDNAVEGGEAADEDNSNQQPPLHPMLSPGAYAPRTLLFGAKAQHNLEAKVCVSRLGECYTALVTCRAVPKGAELLLDYGKGHRLRSQRWTSFGAERPLTRPRRTSCFPAPLLMPPPAPFGAGIDLLSMGNVGGGGGGGGGGDGPSGSNSNKRPRESAEGEDGRDGGEAANTPISPPTIPIEAGMRLYWQCAHCGHHSHAATYPTHVLLCESCEAPRAANVAMAVAYTPSTTTTTTMAAAGAPQQHQQSQRNEGAIPLYSGVGSGSAAAELTTDIPPTDARFVAPSEGAQNIHDRLSSPLSLSFSKSGGGGGRGAEEGDELMARHFEPCRFNARHWAHDQPHRAVVGGGVCGGNGYTNSSEKSSPSPLSPAGAAGCGFAGSAAVDNGSSGGAVVVSQHVLTDAHRFGVSAVPAPFPLNFTFIPWHVHDSRVPLSEIRAAPPPIASDIQIQEVAETIKLRIPITTKTTTASANGPVAAAAAAEATCGDDDAANTVDELRKMFAPFDATIGNHVRLCAAGASPFASSSVSATPPPDGASGFCLPTTFGVQRMGIATAVRSDGKVWRRGDEVGAVGGIVLFASDPRIADRRWCRGGAGGDLSTSCGDRLLSGQRDESVLGLEKRVAALFLPKKSEAKPAPPANNNATCSSGGIVKARPPVPRAPMPRNTFLPVPFENAATNPHLVTGDGPPLSPVAADSPFPSPFSSSCSALGGGSGGVLPPQRAFFAIPLRHTRSRASDASPFDGICAREVGDGEMVLVPTNEFAHIAVVPSSASSTSAPAATATVDASATVPPLPFLRSAAFAADPAAKPNVTFVASMDHLGCVFVAAVALTDITHTTELLVSEDDVIMLY